MTRLRIPSHGRKNYAFRFAEFVVVLGRQEGRLLREIAMAPGPVDLQENKHFQNSTLRKRKA